MSHFHRIANWYFSRKALPFWCIFLADCLIVFCSLLLVYALNNGIIPTLQVFWPLCATLAVYLIFFILGFRIFHTYSGIIRYSSFVDLQRIAAAMLLGLVLSICTRYAFSLNDVFVPIRARDLALGSLLALLLIWSERVIVKYAYDSLYRQELAKRIFIYGIREGGVSIAKSIRNQDPPKYVVAGFVTDTPEMYGRILLGVKVYPNDEHLIDIIRKQNVKAIFVSPYRSESLRENTAMVNALIDAGVKIFMVPSEQEWDGKSDIHHQQLREVQIEDLLPREKIDVDMNAIGRQLRDKRILITGAAGSIGSEIVRQVALFAPSELILIDQAETPLHDVRLMMQRDFPEIKALTIVADIANKERMRKIFSDNKPEYVFHAAAYKHVPMMEDNPWEAIRNNVEGTRIIADLAVEFGTGKFVMVSTDKAVNPTNIMGCSKRICEIYVQSLDEAIKAGTKKGSTAFITTRFGNVLGSNGSVIPLFREQIKKGGPLTVTHPDIIRYFMLIPEACKLVLEAGTMGQGGEIFVFDMGKPVKIVDLAKRMIRLSGANVEIRFTGLRDGEKLYEEVLADKEENLPTFHPKIMIASTRRYDYNDANSRIDELLASSFRDDDMTLVGLMKQMVPEFRSQHSVFEALDK